MVQEKAEQIFLVQPKAHQYKFVETNKTVPMDPLWLVALFEHCQTANKVLSVLDKLKERIQPKEKEAAHLPVACSCGLNHWHHCRKNHDYHQSDQCNHDKHQHDSCYRDDQHNNYSCHKEKDFRKKPYEKIDDCRHNHFKKKEEVMRNDHLSSLSADTLSRKGVALWQGFFSLSCLCQAAAKGAM